MYAPCLMFMLVNGAYGPELQMVRCQPAPPAGQYAVAPSAGYGQAMPYAGPGGAPLFAGGGCSGGSVQFGGVPGGYGRGPVAPPAVQSYEPPPQPGGYGVQFAPPYSAPPVGQYSVQSPGLPYGNGYGRSFAPPSSAYGQGQPAYQASSPCPVCVGGR